MHIHLDLVGGIAGDMFLAAVVHAWPETEAPIIAAMRAAGLPDNWSAEASPALSAGITGMRFRISGDAGHHHHATSSFKDIRARLLASTLSPEVAERSVAIFQLLAEAEAEIHGKSVDEVHFHEIADWDSVADIVGAATAIEHLGASGWSVGDIPMGGGSVKTAHGDLPVPAPATSLLLRGLRMSDDGIPGERVTPTGAAILAYLNVSQDQRRPAGRLARTGHGMGTRKLEGRANMVRLLAFETRDAATKPQWGRADEIGVISFEVDDQTGEDLAVGIEALRETDGVLDVVQYAVTGKKGRMAVSIRVLCRIEAIETAIEACFVETTTIGLRYRIEQRMLLEREEVSVTAGVAGPLGAKRVTRPDGVTTMKVDMDALAREASGQGGRARVRRLAEGDDDGER
jgi:uncharacterized protein (TIGR00299 family) protein